MIPFPIKRIQFDWIILVPFFLALKNVCLFFFLKGLQGLPEFQAPKNQQVTITASFFVGQLQAGKILSLKKLPKNQLFCFCFAILRFLVFTSLSFFFYQWTCSSLQKHIHKMSEIHNSSLMVDFWSQGTFFSPKKKKITRQEGGEEVQQLGKVCSCWRWGENMFVAIFF